MPVFGLLRDQRLSQSVPCNQVISYQKGLAKHCWPAYRAVLARGADAKSIPRVPSELDKSILGIGMGYSLHSQRRCGPCLDMRHSARLGASEPPLHRPTRTIDP